ncbi:hypothetical protein TRAPUB_1181, partial [Trametes pubescens]
MPKSILARLMKVLRKYMWDDKHNTPVSMAHLYLPFELGGLKLLDLEARNEAIDITWLKSYLSFGPCRPLWASVADAIFALNVPKDCRVKEDMRVSPFLQHWKPKVSSLPAELKDPEPVCNERLDMKLAQSELHELIIATDGSCIKNGERDAQAGAGLYVEEGHPLNRSVRLPLTLEQLNQTGEAIATFLASSTLEVGVNVLQETDSKTVMDALTKYRAKHEDTGFIMTKNGQLTCAILAALRARKAHTGFKWVKGHDGHPRNEGADKQAGAGALLPPDEDINLAAPEALRLSGAKLARTTQKIAYSAIRTRKEKTVPPRPSTVANIANIASELGEICKYQVRDDAIWLSLRKKDITREARQFMWKTIHDAFMVGRHWLRQSMPDPLRERATCKVCLELESMDHILFRCQAEGWETICSLFEEIWRHTGIDWPGMQWGTML